MERKPVLKAKAKKEPVKKELNIKYIQEALLKGFQYTDKAKEQDLVLLIGNTGVGKSTTANYLLGSRMIETLTEHGKSVIVTSDKEPPFKIGHKVKAETLYATPVIQPGFPWCLVDCPGFQGIRSNAEDRIIESISIELAIRNSRQIKGIVVLIDLATIEQARPENFLGLIRTLVSIFKNPVEMIDYTNFIITKKPSIRELHNAKSQTVAGIKTLLAHCKEQLEEFEYAEESLNYIGGFKEEEYYSASEYLEVMLKKINEFVFVDPLDQGESRQLIIDRINGVKPRKGKIQQVTSAATSTLKRIVGLSENEIVRPITIDDFNFGQYDEYRTQFNRAIYNLAADATNLLDQIARSVKAVKEAISDQLDFEKRREDIEKLIDSLSKNTLETNDSKIKKEESIANWEAIIASNDIKIQRKQNKIEKERFGIKKTKTGTENFSLLGKLKEFFGVKEVLGILELEEKFKKIDTDNPLLYAQKSINEKAPWYGFLKWYQMDFEVNTEGKFPLLKVVKSCENGKWYDEDDRHEKGIYKITYKSDYYAHAIASVKAYVRTKDEPGNKLKLESFKKEIAEKNASVKKYEAEISELQNTNQKLQTDIEELKQDRVKTHEQRQAKIISYQKDIETYNSKINELKELIIQIRSKGKDLLINLSAMQPQCTVLVEIANLLEFPSSLIAEFPDKYLNVKNKVSEYKKIFETMEILIFEKEETNNEELVDPLTGGPILVPVVVHGIDGKVFDENSLLQKFAGNEIESFIIEIDGKTVEIKNHGWTKIATVQEQLKKREKLKSSNNNYPQLNTEESIAAEVEKLELEASELKKKLNDLQHKIDDLKLRRKNLFEAVHATAINPNDEFKNAEPDEKEDLNLRKVFFETVYTAVPKPNDELRNAQPEQEFINAELKSRKSLKDEAKLKAILVGKVPLGLRLGKAYDHGDCFFDALAQAMNQINETDVNTDKYLRMQCHDFYQKNEDLVDMWNVKELPKTGNHIKQYGLVQYTFDEYEELFSDGTPMWGRPNIEGIILCRQLELEAICFIEIYEDPETKHPVVSFYLVNKDAYKLISKEEAQAWLKNPKIPALVVEQNSLHFVPLLKDLTLLAQQIDIQPEAAITSPSM